MVNFTIDQIRALVSHRLSYLALSSPLLFPFSSSLSFLIFFITRVLYTFRNKKER